MKKMVYTLALCAALGASAASNVVVTTQYADGSTNLWTQGDLKDALGLMNRKYHRDMQTESGRTAWHGAKIGQYLMTNTETRVIYMAKLYSDGYVHHAVAKPVKVTDPEAAAKAKAEAAAKAEAVRAAWEKANLPPELAALRQRQREAAKTNDVTVIIQN